MFSRSSADIVVDLVKRTLIDLSASRLRLHKIASNDPKVIKSFDQGDLAKYLKDLDLDCGDLPSQRTLGIVWNLSSDDFVFKSDMSARPTTKMGILPSINSVFDPLDFLAPFILEGMLILRELMCTKVDWDDIVPTEIALKWENWKESLKDLQMFSIRRCYFDRSLSEMSKVDLHIFSDASLTAISAVVYVKGFVEGDNHVGFVIGKSKLAPEKGHTVPRLELCAAVLAVELYQSVASNLSVDVNSVKFYTDSKVVLGYICNQSKRFYTYVSNRVHKIVSVSNPSQWNFVPSEHNPADIGSRGASLVHLLKSSWLSGPKFLQSDANVSRPEGFPLMNPTQDKEIRKISVKASNIKDLNFGICFFEKFSSWLHLIRAVSTLRHIAISFHRNLPCKGWHICPLSKTLASKEDSVSWILLQVQLEVFSKEIKLLSEGEGLNKDSNILSLDPVLRSDGLLHVAGRLYRSRLPQVEKSPIILPRKHPVSELLVRHYHESVVHQGRQFTEGALRSAGFWIIGAKRLVSSVIHKCVICKKLRGKFSCQKMSDLPFERVVQASPFSYVGVDVFGPWQIVSRRTRGGQALSKRWAVLFTCLTIRAVHIEVLEDLSSSAFTNALRRFVSIRGKVMVYRSDRGTNFIGAVDNIHASAINVEDEHVQSFLQKSGSVWVFNSPHSSHMGGAWERLIGVSRRILDAMLLNVKTLTHDVIVTLMAEISAIVNARPIVPVSYDPDVPDILSPSVLLTQKLESDQPPLGNVDIKDLYRNQWKQVQFLANQFWLRWRQEYLQTLQVRHKWVQEQEPLKIDDIVLLKDSEVARNYWPMGRVVRTFPSKDGRIRKVEICILKEGKKVCYTRPVVNLVVLVRK